MLKRLTRIAIALCGVFLVLLCSIYLGGARIVQKYLAREIDLGSGHLHLVRPHFAWSLFISADSVVYQSGTVHAVSGPARISIDLFQSFTRYAPTLSLTFDTVRVWTTGPGNSSLAQLDTLPFPETAFPAEMTLLAGRVLWQDSLGARTMLDGLQIQTHGLRAASLTVHAAGARSFGDLKTTIHADLNWEDKAWVVGRLSFHRKLDSAEVGVRLDKANMLRGFLEAHAKVISSLSYQDYLSFPKNLPKVEDFSAELSAEIGPLWRVSVSSKAELSNFSNTGSMGLSTQKAEVKAEFSGKSGHWSLNSRGHDGEDIALAGSLFLTAADSLQSPTYYLKHLGMTGKGHVRGVPVKTGGKSLPADLELSDVRLTRESMQVQLITGDGSKVSAEMRHVARWPMGQGSFAVDLAPGERWMKAYTDTNLVFRKLKVQGVLANGSIRGASEAHELKAYGALADSLRLTFQYSQRGFFLEPAHWFQDQRDWTVSGHMHGAKARRKYALSFKNPEAGSAEFRMVGKNLLEAQVKNLAIGFFPFRGLDTLPIKDCKVSGALSWDRKADTGQGNISIQGLFKTAEISASLQAAWTREFLDVQNMQAVLSGSKVEAEATLHLQGRPFYALGQVKASDLVSLKAKSAHFDLAKAFSLIAPESPLKTGSVMGDFSYHDGLGFGGACFFNALEFKGNAVPFSLKELALHGKGDTLVLKAVTVSDKVLLANDTVSVNIIKALGRDQLVFLSVKSSGGFKADFQGDMQDYQYLQGRLAIDGNVLLPGKLGELKGLVLRGQMVLPFKNSLQGLRLDADTLRGSYAIPGLDTQSFSATVKSKAGIISMPHLMVHGKGGDVQGHLEYAVATKRWSAALSGQSLAAQLRDGNTIRIRDFTIDVAADSNQLRAESSIGGATLEQAKSPLRALGNFSRIAVEYRLPLGHTHALHAGGGRLPFLRLAAVLDSSAVRYRLRTLESLQKLFKKSPVEHRVAHRTRPMEVQINIETAGTGNTIETDVLRAAYVGNVSMVGTYPYALLRGRITAREGSLGTKKQAYRIRRFEVKWLNVPLEEGKVDLDSEKKLARTCESNASDSCSVILHLNGTLNDLQFSYDSDCQGSYGDGVQVAALVFSVRRGCYSAGLSGDGSGLSYEEKALTLLETPLSGYLSEAAEKISGKWIASANVTGLGALAQDKGSVAGVGNTGSSLAGPGFAGPAHASSSFAGTAAGSATGNAQDAIALEVLSKEFWRMRLRAKSAYKPDLAEDVSPWAYLLGLEWRPPLYQYIDHPVWKQRVKNNVNVDASVFTDPDRTQVGQDKILRRVGFNYNYDFWGYWWSKPASEDSLRGKPRSKIRISEGSEP